jgi:hypothetical protein
VGVTIITFLSKSTSAEQWGSTYVSFTYTHDQNPTCIHAITIVICTGNDAEGMSCANKIRYMTTEKGVKSKKGNCKVRSFIMRTFRRISAELTRAETYI